MLALINKTANPVVNLNKERIVGSLVEISSRYWSANNPLVLRVAIEYQVKPVITIMHVISKINPSILLIFLFSINIPTKSMQPNNIGNSFLSMLDFTVSGMNIAVIPIINPILAMLEPKTLPSAIFGFPLKDAIHEVTISGDDVPIATTVSPTISEGMPIFLAKDDAPTISQFEPKARQIMPINKNRNLNNMLYSTVNAYWLQLTFYKGLTI